MPQHYVQSKTDSNLIDGILLLEARHCKVPGERIFEGHSQARELRSLRLGRVLTKAEPHHRWRILGTPAAGWEAHTVHIRVQ